MCEISSKRVSISFCEGLFKFHLYFIHFLAFKIETCRYWVWQEQLSSSRGRPLLRWCGQKMWRIQNYSKEIYVTIHQGAKFCFLETLFFYFSNSMDFGENKWSFIHCNSDVEALPKMPSYTLTTLLVGSVAWKSHVSKVQISCPFKLMTWLMYMSPSN